jgi:hypothetical protein
MRQERRGRVENFWYYGISSISHNPGLRVDAGCVVMACAGRCTLPVNGHPARLSVFQQPRSRPVHHENSKKLARALDGLPGTGPQARHA